MAKRNGSTVQVNPLAVNAEFAETGESPDYKSFVDFNHVDIVYGESSARRGFSGRRDWPDAHIPAPRQRPRRFSIVPQLQDHVLRQTEPRL
jgi:hypothetical protein